ncbi:aerotolerance protein [Pontibacter vulgaris]|uniref:aerotolerance protein n=1 Tax=Pontibacter vulgaris TaxID=2905679 RepID=UPI001FA703FF|nr:aerotolerance protein [Pontibacter vulgaris]
MKFSLLLIFLVSLLTGGIKTISKVNQYAQEGAAAYRQKDYAKAMTAYEYLLNDLELQDDQVRLNLAHSYFEAGLLDQAQQTYRLLADNPSAHMRAIAHLQLGHISASQKKYKQALSLFKNALIAEPDNDAARYNYELLKKYLDLHPDKAAEEEQDNLPEPEGQQPIDTLQPPPAGEQEPKPKKKPDSQGNQEAETETGQNEEADKGKAENNPTGKQDNANSRQQPDQGNQKREQKTGNEEGDTKGLNQNGDFDPKQPQRNTSENISDQDERARTQRSRLKQMNISPEKAKMLLDAMRSAELQYIQQLPKKSTVKPDPSKPDW